MRSSEANNTKKKKLVQKNEGNTIVEASTKKEGKKGKRNKKLSEAEANPLGINMKAYLFFC